MTHRYLKSIFLLSAFTSFIMGITGCKTRFEKIRTGNDPSLKYKEAMRLYQKKDYTSAIMLFEDLSSLYRGRSESEQIDYHFAYANYRLKEYLVARDLFKTFVEVHPNSSYVEECQYMIAYCSYMNSPVFSLDQTSSIKAIDYFQLFITLYPNSTRTASANQYITELRGKLEKKAYHTALMYADIGDHKSAVIALRNCLKDFPDTKYAEEMEYLIVKNQYLYAQNSVLEKQEERFLEAEEVASHFIDTFASSKFLKDVTSYKTNSLKIRAKLNTSTLNTP